MTVFSLKQFLPRLWQRWGLFFLFWTLTALSFGTQFYLSARQSSLPISWWDALSSSLADWYLFGLLSIPMSRLAGRFQFDRHNWPVVAGLHLAAGLFFSGLYILIRAVIALGQGSLAGQPMVFGEIYRQLFWKTFHLNLWIYWAILAVSHALSYYRRFHERELRTSELETRLTQARLQALQMQLNPHFLFNTLHTISALVHIDAEAADRMIARLSELLRAALDGTDTQEVTMAEEISFLQRYLEIEKTRFGERLNYRFDVPKELEGLYIPNLILQPLVENAIRHGVEPHARRGELCISARAENGVLELRVSDNGNGLKPGPLRTGRIGLSNTRQRLEQMFGSSGSLELRNRAEGGMDSIVRIPRCVQPTTSTT